MADFSHSLLKQPAAVAQQCPALAVHSSALHMPSAHSLLKQPAAAAARAVAQQCPER